MNYFSLIVDLLVMVISTNNHILVKYSLKQTKKKTPVYLDSRPTVLVTYQVHASKSVPNYFWTG